MSDVRETSIEELIDGPAIDVEPTPVAATVTDKDKLGAAELEAIAKGEELEKFLNTPTVKEAFSTLGKQYTAEWLNADTPEEREKVWALSRALLDVAKELRSVFERGRSAKTTRRKRLARESGVAKRKRA
jgi:hypothetical protein